MSCATDAMRRVATDAKRTALYRSPAQFSAYFHVFIFFSAFLSKDFLIRIWRTAAGGEKWREPARLTLQQTGLGGGTAASPVTFNSRGASYIHTGTLDLLGEPRHNPLTHRKEWFRSVGGLSTTDGEITFCRPFTRIDPRAGRPRMRRVRPTVCGKRRPAVDEVPTCGQYVY